MARGIGGFRFPWVSEDIPMQHVGDDDLRVGHGNDVPR